MSTKAPEQMEPANPPPWKRIVLAASLWLLGSSIAGALVALVNGEHGSMIFAMLGLAVGIAGGISHALLLLLAPRFRSSAEAIQVLVVWAATVALLLISTLFTAEGSGSRLLAITDGISLVLVYAAVPALVAAAVFTRILNHAG